MRKYDFSGINYSAQGGGASAPTPAPVYKTKSQAQEEKNRGGFFGGIAYLGEKLATGFTQTVEGFTDYTFGGLAKLFGADDWAEEIFKNDWFGDWYSHPDEWYNPSEGWKIAGDVAGGIGTSLPSLGAAAGALVLSGGTAPLISAIAGGASAALGAAGSGTKQAYAETGELGAKEFIYGGLSGAVEGVTEGITNALSLGTGAIAKNIGKAFGKQITGSVAGQSALKGLFGAFMGEAFEEGFSEWINPYIARATYDADAENATADQIGYAALIGGLSGLFMEGVSTASDVGNSFARGAALTSKGAEAEVIELSRSIAAFQDENATESEAFKAVASTYKELSESLETTGGKITTAAQKKMLGDLSRANIAAVFSPMIVRSAANIYADAEAIAQRLNTYEYTDAKGKAMRFTADQIREGIDPKNKKSFENALKTNTVLRSLAVADVTGQLMMNTRAFQDAVLAGKRLAGRADLWNFAENATAEEINAVSDALGIENWETLTEDEFAEKIAKFLQSGGAESFARERDAKARIFADTTAAAPMPRVISLADGESRKYASDDGEFAIGRKGDEYRIYDFATKTATKAMSRADVNKALADDRERRSSILSEARENERRQAEIKRKREETDKFARENVKSYAELAAPAKTMVRKVIAAARASGLTDADAAMYATVSAHAGLDITFSKKLCRVDDGYADGFYDPAKNRIVVNPESTRSAESLLLHELDHAVRSGIRKDGGTKMFADAVFGIGDEAAQKITARYKNVESDVSKTELIWDEANAYFAETFFANKGVLESLTEKAPTVKERILAFLEGAKVDYAGAPKLEGAAKRYYKQYKKMFDEFAERNRGRNAEEARREGKIGDARFSLQFADAIAADQRKFVTDGKVREHGRRYALPEDYKPTKADKEYISALERWDMETAQKMVDEVAKAAGYVPVSRYHQTGAKFNEFMNDHPDAGLNDSDTPNGFFFKENDHDIGVGADFVKTGHGGSIQMRVYLKHNNMLYFKDRDEARVWYSNNVPGYRELLEKYDEHLSDFKKINSENNKKMFDELIALEESGQSTTEKELAIVEKYGKIMDEWIENRQKYETSLRAEMRDLLNKYFIENDSGYDGIEMADDGHRYIDMKREDVHTFIVFKNTQIKSADPVTYDDNGNVIPLSQRFKNDNPDIRYALPFDEDALPEDDTRMFGAKEMNEVIDEMMREGDIAPARDIVPASKLGESEINESGEAAKRRHLRAERAISLLPYSSEIDRAGISRLKASLVGAMEKLDSGEINADLISTFAQTFAESFAEDLSSVKRIREGYVKGEKNKYVYPYRNMDAGEREALELDIFEQITQALNPKGEKEDGRTEKSARREADFYKAKLEEQIATDRAFREGMREDFDRRLENVIEREKSAKKYYGERVKIAEIEKKQAEHAAERVKLEERENAREAVKRAVGEYSAELERMQNELERGKREMKESEREMRYRNYIGARVEKLATMKKGTFANASVYKDNTFDKILGTLVSIEWRKNFSAKKAEKAIDELSKWYVTDNKLFGYVDEKNPGDYDANLAEQINELAMLPQEELAEADNLKTLDEILGGLTKFIEHYNKVYISGKWVEAKPIAEGFVGTLRSGAKIKDGFFRNLGRNYLEGFGDAASVMRYYDRYQKDGFFGSSFDMLRQAAIKSDTENFRIMTPYEKFMSEHPKYLEKTSTQTVNFSGVEMPKRTAISLYMTMKREHNHAGLCASGFAFNDANGKKVRVDAFDIEAAKDPYDGMAIKERLAAEREEAFSQKVKEARKTAEEYRKKKAESKAKLDELRKSLPSIPSGAEEINEAIRVEEKFAAHCDEIIRAQNAVIAEYSDLARAETEEDRALIRKFREDAKSERAKRMLGVVEQKRAELRKLLNDDDLAYIKTLESGYVEAGKLKSERDLERYGFTNVSGDYYYPTRRANSAKSVDTSLSSELDRVSNASFNKDIVKGAAGELYIQEADSLFRNHVKAVCNYAALSPAIEAYNKLYNMDISGNPNKPTSVKTESENVWNGADRYFRDLIGDIQGVPRTREGGSEILSRARSGYAKFQLGANPKTWASQLSSIFTSTSVLDISNIAQAAAKGVSGKDVDKYCEIAMLRNADNTAAMAQGVLSPGERARSGLDKVSDALMKPIGMVDRAVICRLFAACQVQTEKNGGAKIGSEENKKAAGKLLEKVILETQQNSFATEKSAAMRSSSEIKKTLTMFSADGMKMFGRVIDGFGEVSAIRSKIRSENASESANAELKKAKSKLARSVGALALSSLHMAIVAQFFRHLYDKKEDDDTVAAVTLDMALDFGGGMLGGLPLFRDLYTKLTDGFGIENCTTAMLNDLLDSTSALVTLSGKAMKGSATPQETARAAKSMIYAACQFGGIPARNAMNVLTGLTKRFLPETAYRFDNIFYEKNYVSDLKKAAERSDERMTDFLLSLASEQATGNALSEKAHGELRRLTLSGYNVLPKSVGDTLRIDGAEHVMSERERQSMTDAYSDVRRKLDELFSSTAYHTLSDENKVKAIKYVYSAAYDDAAATVFGTERTKKALVSKAVGFGTAAICDILTGGITADNDANGKTISGSKRKKTVAAINSLPISAENKLLLICSEGYALSDADLRGLSENAAKRRLSAYISSLGGISQADKLALAKMCGIEIQRR